MVIGVVQHLVNVFIQNKYIYNIMKLLFIYLAVVLAISFYVWVNILKEGNQDTDMKDINKRLGSTYTDISGQKNRDGTQARTEIDTSPNILSSKKVTPGITTIDRYEDPMCILDGKQEHIYCVDGQIECQDILGDLVNNNLNVNPLITDYEGNTFTNTCNSHINKINLSDYNQIETTIDTGTGVYFDLSNCTDPDEGPWRAGGIVEKIGKESIITPDSYSCYPSQSAAKNAINEEINITMNENQTYNVNDDVFILDSYLRTQNKKGLSSLLSILDKTKNTSLDQSKEIYTTQLFKTINGQKYYYGIIVKTGNTYTVKMTGDNISIDIENVPKTALLKNSLYNKKSKDYYSDLKTGSHKRPVCKSGRFTSCLSSSPFTIENGMYVTKDPSLTLYTDGSDPNMKRSIYNRDNNLIAKTPFSEPPVNTSGIIDNADIALLEYNYFNSQSNTPFVKCIADYGSSIGDPLCCNQKGYVEDTKYICPEEVPTCRGYSDNAYGYCN